jgi:mannose-6-phosphate isomerase-like protein (cupin superfamily)
MKNATLDFSEGFRVALGNARSQAAVMVLAPGEKEGGPGNRHAGADQWLIVTEGEGVAVVEGREVALRAGSAVLIEKGDRHEIRNTGQVALKTINVYLPPAYDAAGEALPAGRG